MILNFIGQALDAKDRQVSGDQGEDETTDAGGIQGDEEIGSRIAFCSLEGCNSDGSLGAEMKRRVGEVDGSGDFK